MAKIESAPIVIDIDDVAEQIIKRMPWSEQISNVAEEANTLHDGDDVIKLLENLYIPPEEITVDLLEKIVSKLEEAQSQAAGQGDTNDEAAVNRRWGINWGLINVRQALDELKEKAAQK